MHWPTVEHPPPAPVELGDAEEPNPAARSTRKMKVIQFGIFDPQFANCASCSSTNGMLALELAMSLPSRSFDSLAHS